MDAGVGEVVDPRGIGEECKLELDSISVGQLDEQLSEMERSLQNQARWISGVREVIKKNFPTDRTLRVRGEPSD